MPTTEPTWRGDGGHGRGVVVDDHRVVRQVYLGLAKWWTQLRDAPTLIWSQPDAFQTPTTLPYLFGAITLIVSLVIAWRLATVAQRRFEGA